MDLPWYYSLKKIYFRNKTSFVFQDRMLKLSVSVWNWISWNLTKILTHSAISDNCYFHFFYGLSDWVEILWGFTNFNFKQILKVSAFYLERQKSFIPKKIFFLAVVNFKTKNLCLLTQFSRRFWILPNTICDQLTLPTAWYRKGFMIS